MDPLAPKPVAEALSSIHRRPSRFSFGIPRLDLRVGDVGPGDLVAVGTNGSVAVGPLLAFVALEAARRGVVTLFVADTIAERTTALYWLAAATRIDAAELRDQALPAEAPAVMSAIAELATKPLHYADSADRSIAEVVELVGAMPSRPGLVVIDLVSSALGANDAVGASLRALRRAAAAHDCVVLASVAMVCGDDCDAERLPFLGSDPTTQHIPTVFLELDSDDGPAGERRVRVHLTRTRGGETGFVPLLFRRGSGRFDEWLPGATVRGREP